MNKINFLKFLLSEQDAGATTDVTTMDSTELRRLSSMDTERRKREYARKRRQEQMETKSTRLRSLLKQKENIEKLIAAERAKMG